MFLLCACTRVLAVSPSSRGSFMAALIVTGMERQLHGERGEGLAAAVHGLE